MTAATTAAESSTAAASTGPVYVKPPAPKNRLGPGWYNRVLSLVGLPRQRRLGWAALQVPRIRELEGKFDSFSEEELKTAGLELRGRARGGARSAARAGSSAASTQGTSSAASAEGMETAALHRGQRTATPAVASVNRSTIPQPEQGRWYSGMATSGLAARGRLPVGQGARARRP
jgi:hypothetical protein